MSSPEGGGAGLEQVELLARAEQRLSETQRALEEQVRRIEIVNRLALATAGAEDVDHLLDHALEALLSAFPFDRAMAFVRREDILVPCAARTPAGRSVLVRSTAVLASRAPSSIALWEADEASAPWLSAIANALRDAPRDERAPQRLLLLPVSPAAVLAACTSGAPAGPSRSLPGEADRSFLELLARHVGVALESRALRRRTAESETLFQAAFANATTGMALVDGQGTFALVNGALCALLGASEHELVGRPVRELTHPADLAKTKDALSRGREDAGFRAFDMEKRYLRVDGSVFWARTTGARVDATPSRPGYWFIQITDITERRDHEETERLATVGRLAAGVAHEINNPLTYVLFELESLGRSKLEGRAAQAIEHALSGSKRIARIVRDLKTFARRGSDETLEPVDLARVVEVVLEMCSAEVRHRAQVTLHLASGTVVRATEARLAQVLMNLVINAAHAIGEGDIERDEIEVCTFTDETSAYVTVRDTGVGIAPEDQRRVFEPFFTTKGPGLGSGLGLSISAAIVESYGGSLTVASEVGRGSAFTVRLPRYRAEPPAERSARDAGEAPAATPDGARPRVLIVDDEPMVLRSLSLALEDCEVFTADGAAAARAVIAREPRLDALVCDLMMPGESGGDLYEWLGVHHPDLARRTIFVTGGAFMPRAQALVATVTNTVLEKPFDLDRLRGLIGVLAAQR